ncbi:MAG: ATP-binding cassette domain-containing protein [Synergistaceae bacterium]|jgi:ABC-type glutathione transport system ATPase component|nr:ATP-binding cassette domain-containing protein [Synergistaceae bacterium]
MRVVVAAESLGVQYGGFWGRSPVWAVRGVSFSLAPGETLAVVGESGSGKTTLLRALLGLVSTSEGSASFDGVSYSSMTDAEKLAARRRCGYAPQDPYASLPPTLTVFGAVVEPWNIVKGKGSKGSKGSKEGDGADRARALLAEMKLPEALWGARVRYALSGGQRQRVALARALVLEPELLLCDEPTAMQDASTRGEVLDVLKRRVAAGAAMIIVTHDLLLARRAAARTMVMKNGSVVESGESEEVFERPKHEYTRALLAALPRIASQPLHHERHPML